MHYLTHSLRIFCLLLAWSDGFHHLQKHNTFPHTHYVPSSVSVLFRNKQSIRFDEDSGNNLIALITNRLDTVSAAGLENVHTAGGGVYIFGIRTLFRRAKKLPQDIENLKNLPQNIQVLTWKDVKPIKRIKSLHGPITYLILSVFLARKYNKLLNNMIFWLWNAFCIKWFRARYVFKIPVWDRQPNWNNVITSKEQEKDLKAFTCKTCGSTIFIAKTREFFFEGDTGIGGLGCFSCGAKGADNFVMDRDRIVEDVADIDDYFEYERPLDFISAAERRALLKEAGGDEDKANKILVERDSSQASEESQAKADAIVNGATGPVIEDENSEEVVEGEKENTSSLAATEDECEGEATSSTAQAAEESVSKVTDSAQLSSSSSKSEKLSSGGSNEDLDLLDMDDF